MTWPIACGPSAPSARAWATASADDPRRSPRRRAGPAGTPRERLSSAPLAIARAPAGRRPVYASTASRRFFASRPRTPTTSSSDEHASRRARHLLGPHRREHHPQRRRPHLVPGAHRRCEIGLEAGLEVGVGHAVMPVPLARRHRRGPHFPRRRRHRSASDGAWPDAATSGPRPSRRLPSPAWAMRCSRLGRSRCGASRCRCWRRARARCACSTSRTCTSCRASAARRSGCAGSRTSSPTSSVSTGDNLAATDAVPAVLEAYGPLLHRPGVFVLGSNDYWGPRPKNPARYFLPHRGGRPIVGVRLPTQELVAGFTAARLARPHERPRHQSTWRAGRSPSSASTTRTCATTGTRGQPHRADADLVVGVTHAPYRRVLDVMTADGADLVLAGHTHGGQLRLPIAGALVTNCDLPRRQARGVSDLAGRRPHGAVARQRRPRHHPLHARPVRLPARGEPADADAAPLTPRCSTAAALLSQCGVSQPRSAHSLSNAALAEHRAGQAGGTSAGQVAPAVLEVAPRAARQNPAADEHDDLVGQRQRRPLRRRPDDGDAALAQRLPQLELGDDVERGGDVVGDEQLRLRRQRPGQGEPLQLTTGEPGALVPDEQPEAVVAPERPRGWRSPSRCRRASRSRRATPRARP